MIQVDCYVGGSFSFLPDSEVNVVDGPLQKSFVRLGHTRMTAYEPDTDFEGQNQ